MRADAQRNRDRIVEVAREVFREQGYDASLDEIARRAEVGPGTLYRHFPRRENLVDAVMQAWVDRVDAAADVALSRTGPPRERLLAWFEDYVGLITLHRGGAVKLTSALGDETSPIRTKCRVLTSAMGRVLDSERPALREGVDDVQVCRLVGGVATVADSGGLAADQVRPMLGVVVDGVLALERAGAVPTP
ncbi:TetR/AcrR family transcriptional regulator [Phycicoccus sonneratiae]|uniref:TetR/AcrR family transcriptional regulator n=1 Tax=Phycicoccus sonneratiae TaxID=2807628 RepID=A0ABS2CMU5_9MICO|nr:TetR/AcrR family transcriptional regulator [Phycicoccus sonneraticus]MBM6400404.1 TetR/AcrR family transcriptional regulator [Phycicoccus sonneraticus]